MTLDVTTFLVEKDGDPEAIRESQRKRGHSVELVDEVINLYKEWVKSMCYPPLLIYLTVSAFYLAGSTSLSGVDLLGINSRL
jgi:hypothetical protein